MTETRFKRNKLASYLNTGTVAEPTWSLIGTGVPSAEIEMNPKTNEECNIDDESASTYVESYAPSMPIEATAYNGSEIFEYIDAMRISRSILGDAESEVVNVYVYETPALTYYEAEKSAVSISFEKFGGPGESALKISFTLNYLGNPTLGTFSPSDLEFVADPVNTILTTMVIGEVTLTPLFATNKAWLWYAGSVANGVTEVAMTSTLEGATIVQYVEDAEVEQAANAALAVGVNHLTISVTVGEEVSVYAIDITRAAA
jgi:hypothetical protein